MAEKRKFEFSDDLNLTDEEGRLSDSVIKKFENHNINLGNFTVNSTMGGDVVISSEKGKAFSIRHDLDEPKWGVFQEIEEGKAGRTSGKKRKNYNSSPLRKVRDDQRDYMNEVKSDLSGRGLSEAQIRDGLIVAKEALDQAEEETIYQVTYSVLNRILPKYMRKKLRANVSLKTDDDGIIDVEFVEVKGSGKLIGTGKKGGKK